jgi:ADP-ribose pyrophosphatase
MYMGKKYVIWEWKHIMEFYETTLSSKQMFSGNLLKLRVDEVLLPNGRKSTREIVEHPGAVAVVAITENDEVLMVRQYRKAIERELLEIPAGKLEEGESREVCVERELMEETGYFPNELTYLTSFYTSPGFSNEILHLFIAKNLIKKSRDADFDEYLQAEKVPFEEAINKIRTGEIVDSKTITGLLLAYDQIKGDL